METVDKGVLSFYGSPDMLIDVIKETENEVKHDRFTAKIHRESND